MVSFLNEMDYFATLAGKFIMGCLDYLSFEFQDIFLAIYAISLLFPDPSQKCFS